ncbi:hypothetical protein PPO43_13420 [Saprospira sp. CCB-QB6]|uniref:hypothetical protein n=1 Tax=Saprospira sp. CCB-QB6 TaxID=3023936 RepID=UPI0023495000|nr:hypothetical protein [Saprospira sp. CCB-QB6]WCL80968.1 hypothetical protein PPO43_13420 [Saprospira sp. CCB-QB6]
MAIYQYYLKVLPKQGVEKKHDSLPARIAVSTASGYFESDAKIYWKEVAIEATAIVSKVDALIKRANWGNNKTSFHWKTYSDKTDNDADLYLAEDSLLISEFSFRADLREEGCNFLKNMIRLGQENDYLFMDRKGNLMPPDFQEIKNSIQASNAYRFLKNPVAFLKSLEDEE